MYKYFTGAFVDKLLELPKGAIRSRISKNDKNIKWTNEKEQNDEH
jgi:hypothetical protein